MYDNTTGRNDSQIVASHLMLGHIFGDSYDSDNTTMTICNTHLASNNAAASYLGAIHLIIVQLKELKRLKNVTNASLK